MSALILAHTVIEIRNHQLDDTVAQRIAQEVFVPTVHAALAALAANDIIRSFGLALGLLCAASDNGDFLAAPAARLVVASFALLWTGLLIHPPVKLGLDPQSMPALQAELRHAQRSISRATKVEIHLI